ncbi:MAG: VOC family protein [Xanthobacteraceae bacterium]
MQTQIYLFFEGRTDEALEFYKKTLGAEVEMLMRFKDSPEPAREECGPAALDKVMHSCFKLGDQRVMASDGEAKGNPNFQGFALSLAVRDAAEADRVFNALAQGGQVKQPLIESFFSPKFGIVRDKFGVSWMVMVSQT